MALNLVAKVHPVVFFTIVDSYERRNPDAHRVIGTLLVVVHPSGTIGVDKGAIEITNCFCVPHNESKEEVAVELDFAKDMYELHRKVNPGEVIVGWWATGHEITDHSLLIHDYYSRVTNNPIHLTVDTTLHGGRMNIKGYVSASMGVPGRTPGTMFAPIPVEVISYAPEIVGTNATQKSKYSRQRLVDPTTDLHQISEATQNMEATLETLISYVDDVLSGKVPADNYIGRELTRMVNQVPKMSAHDFEEMLNTNMKDLLMVIYLSQLTKVNVSLNEKLTMLVATQ
ncbi:Eukaryotic translation initiation factor 3 subunit F-1-like 1 [Homarus americanus]|uniref:Eukaryotic translation initiation factor 3 subunit F n=1 Tax=Homarus americanus TaxID=6706 RepID=A0A8J5TKB2_HOMAM|nr:Eukaryotic translation initiation factor 3 subunit F-1-like 1 [Homarus americanus]